MKAIIFDFNGTLFDDTRFHIEAWGNFMRKRFSMDLSQEEILSNFIGPGNQSIFRRYFGDRYTDAEIDAFSGEKEAEYRAAVRSRAENMRLIDGAPELLDRLVVRGIPFALATASRIENVRFYLDELGLKKWFSLDRVVYEDGTLPGKPNPAFYLEAARRLGLPPADCLVAEDSLTGVEAASRAGVGKIVCIDRSTPGEKLLQNPRVCALIHDFWDFERWI